MVREPDRDGLQALLLALPFGLSLFYLEGVGSPQVRTVNFYGGVVPSMLMLVAVVGSTHLLPALYGPD